MASKWRLHFGLGSIGDAARSSVVETFHFSSETVRLRSNELGELQKFARFEAA